MNLSHPVVSLIPSLRGYVLEVLAKTTRPLSGREVHRLLARKASHVGVQRVLDDLAAEGLVIRQQAGKTVLNSLNREHILAPLVLDLVGVGQRIPKEVAVIVGEEAGEVEKAILFGSLVEGEADSESDVDLLLVWPDGTPDDTQAEAAHRICERVERLLGNPCRPLHYTAAEYAGLADTAPDLFESIAGASIDLPVGGGWS